jgi:amidase
VLAGAPRPPEIAEPPGRLRVVFTSKPPTPTPVEPPVRDAVVATARRIEALGHDVDERDVFGGFRDAQRVAFAVLARFLAGTREYAARLEQPERLEPRTRAVVRAARLVPAGALRAAARVEAAEQRRLAHELAGVDAILMPVSARTAQRADAWDGLGAARSFFLQSRLIPFTPSWNLVGWPAIALPAGRDPAGVPLGVQLIARPGGEPALLALAAQVERARLE